MYQPILDSESARTTQERRSGTMQRGKPCLLLLPSTLIFWFPWLLTYLLAYLVGGAITILKNDGVKVNGKDDIPYMMEK